jgi:serine/threonine protein kinase
MTDPVVCADGQTYERHAIEGWFARGRMTSPSTGAALPDTTLTPNIGLRNAIEEWQENHALHLRKADIEMEERPFAAGSFKNVYRGSLRITVRGGESKRVVVAVLKMRRGDCATEARMLLKIGRHPRVVRFLGQCVDGEDQLLITEFAPLGSLSDAFETLGNRFTLAHSMVMMQQIAQAMEHLASEGIIHRDLAARNVLVFAFDENDVLTMSVKLSDYGMAVGCYTRTHVSLASGERPIRYMPPEALRRDRFSEKSDVWAFGVLCWEILTSGVIPYFEILEERVITHVCDGGRLQLVGDSQLVAACPAALWSLITSCWCTSPEDRPGFSGVVTTLGSMSAQMALHRAVRAEALLAEERLEREELARDKTDLEAQLARVNLEKRQEEEKAVRAEALSAEERREREKLARDKTDLEAQLARLKLEKLQADKALQEAQHARVPPPLQAEEVHYLDKTRAIG